MKFKNGSVSELRSPAFLFKLSKKLNIEQIIARFLVFHEYCFTTKFVRRLLSDHGFKDIEVCNASLSGGSLIHRFSRLHGLPRGKPRGSAFHSFHNFSFAIRSIEAVEKLTDLIFGGRALWGPSLEVIARKK